MSAETMLHPHKYVVVPNMHRGNPTIRLMRLVVLGLLVWLMAACAFAGRAPAPEAAPSVVSPTATVRPSVPLTPSPVPAAQPIPTATPAPKLRDPRLGINETFRAAALADELGAGWTRWTIAWPEIQPRGPHSFNPHYLDRRVLRRERAAGRHVAGIVIGTPAWAARDPEHGPRSVPRNLDLPVFLADGRVNRENYWAAFMYDMAREYADEIEAWFIWNEVEIPPHGPNGMYHTWAGTLEECYLLLKVAYQAVKRANPQALVVSAPYSFHTDKGWARRFLELIARDPEAPAQNYFFDAFAINLFRNAHDPWDRMYGAPHALDPLDRPGLRNLFAAAGFSKPVWLAELNAMPYDDPHVPGWDPATRNDAFRITQDEQASFVIQAYAIALAAGYDKVFWQAMQDDPPPVQDELWGLVRFHLDPENTDPARLRPAYRAYKVMAETLGGAERIELAVLTRPDPENRRALAPRYEWLVQLVVAQRGRQRSSIVWNSGPDPLTVGVPRQGSRAYLLDKYGNRSLPQLSEDGRMWVITLEPATRRFVHPTLGSDPEGYFYVGGSPVILIEEEVPPDAPVLPPVRLT